MSAGLDTAVVSSAKFLLPPLVEASLITATAVLSQANIL